MTMSSKTARYGKSFSSGGFTQVGEDRNTIEAYSNMSSSTTPSCKPTQVGFPVHFILSRPHIIIGQRLNDVSIKQAAWNFINTNQVGVWAPVADVGGTDVINPIKEVCRWCLLFPVAPIHPFLIDSKPRDKRRRPTLFIRIRSPRHRPGIGT